MPRWAEADGQEVRPEPLEGGRKRLAKLLSRKTKAMRNGIQRSEAIIGDGATIFRHACWMDLEGIVSKRIGSPYRPAEPQSLSGSNTCIALGSDTCIASRELHLLRENGIKRGEASSNL